MRYFFTLLCLVSSSFIMAQGAAAFAVKLQVQALENPARMEISWDTETGSSLTLFRKAPDESTWQQIANPSSTETSYTDTDIDEGVEYEYSMSRSGSVYAIGYAHAGVKTALPAHRGRALVFVSDTIATSLAAEVNQLINDLNADGWVAEMQSVSEAATVADVKDMIIDANTAGDLQMIYLLGHVPVPYSGNLAPDAHNDNHLGAWPADVYYAEIDGFWTDNSVNNTTASDTRNHNVPNDGKFDQSTLPSSAELMVGRADFSDLPVFAQDEIELTRRYLERVHAYKRGEWTLERRALVDDNFGAFGTEAFASNAWRNFSPLIGRDSISAGDYRTGMANASYLFSYGCGGGSFTSAGGIGTSAQLATDSLLTGFTMLFGSYFGDWDRQNNFMRSALAQGRTMSISWAGRPHWHYQAMGNGYPIGYCARLTQNNFSTYTTNYGARFVHIALLGDPSLRMEYPTPPSALQADTIDTFHVQLSWTASSDPELIGYHVYQRSIDSPWFRRTAEPIATTSYLDSCVIYEGTYTYMVKAVTMVDGYSGSYYNESLGAMAEVTISTTKYPEAEHMFVHDDPANPTAVRFVAETQWVTSIEWTVEGNTLTGNNVAYQPSGAIGDQLSYTVEFGNVCESVLQGRTIVLNAAEVDVQRGVNIYPNPVRSGEVIRIESALDVKHVWILDLEGNQVHLDQSLLSSGLTCPSLAAGVYVLVVSTSKGEFRQLLTVL